MSEIISRKGEDETERERVAGALRLLDRVPPASYLQEWTVRIAAAKQVTLKDTQSVLIFRLKTEWLALPVQLFQEVAESPARHTLPHRRSGVVAGVVSLRGELLLCVSLAAVLGLEVGGVGSAGHPERFRRVLVTSRGGRRLTFPVEEVAAVHRYHPDELRALPATLAEGGVKYTTGLLPWQDHLVGCLDEVLLFSALERSLS